MAINLESIQNTIGYEFNNTDILQQAFVRRSYSEEHGGQNNEVLEFIGDKALDLAVIRIMMDEFGQIFESIPEPYLHNFHLYLPLAQNRNQNLSLLQQLRLLHPYPNVWMQLGKLIEYCLKTVTLSMFIKKLLEKLMSMNL